MKNLLKSTLILIANILFLTGTSYGKHIDPTEYTACYYPFDKDRYVPFSERSIHTSHCYTITNEEFTKINTLISESAPVNELDQYNPQNVKVFIHNNSTTIYIDRAGIAKIDGSKYKNLGVTRTQDVIRIIFNTRRVLPHKKL